MTYKVMYSKKMVRNSCLKKLVVGVGLVIAGIALSGCNTAKNDFYSRVDE